MTRRAWGIVAGVAGLALVGAAFGAARPSGPLLRGDGPFVDDFDRGLCVGGCAGAIWAVRQEVAGGVATIAAPGRPGLALRAVAGPKRGDVVAKAALIARTLPVGRGSIVSIAFDLYVPAATPLDSIQLVDLECATCGEGGNPGIRLYLRRGRLRIDRSKIGIAHAWVRDDALALAHDRWHHVLWTVRLDAGAGGATRVTLDGQEVLSAEGATLFPGGDPHIDRIQIGVTANSNAVPVTLYIDRVALQRRAVR
ncbi:MAG TPA: LamG-like jellyroll fold domain-containing protein [Sphingomonas sp.]|uniref:LamG-like jellyroll fold domain-containing protein n=1 Tax=Sphingomonas sp. TaxID=28214 RepID=UPI002ED83EE6